MSEDLSITRAEPMPVAQQQSASPAAILQAVVDRGITSENVSAVKELVAMCREVRAEEAKALFSKAFFRLRKDAPEIYADKEVKDDSGRQAFRYVSPEELSKTVEPMLLRHGFTTLVGQTMPAEGRVEITLTLMHEEGHSETRAYTVRVSPGNKMMNATKCDEAATTSALRHLMIKMFGLKTRLQAEDDPRNEGGPISPGTASDLRRRVREVGADEKAFLLLAAGEGKTFEDILENKYDMLDALLSKKERLAQKPKAV